MPLYRHDIAAPRARPDAAKIGVLSESRRAHRRGLAAIQADIESPLRVKTELEDVHMNIEARLTERIGAPQEAAHRPSRNDQWRPTCVSTCDGSTRSRPDRRVARILVDVPSARSTRHAGFTHLQIASRSRSRITCSPGAK